MILIMFTLLCIFQILDIYQSKIIFDCGCTTEWNPIINYFADKFGFLPAVIGIKIIVFLFFGFTLYLWNKGKKYDKI